MAANDLPSGMELFALNPAFRENPDAPLKALREKCPVRLDPDTKGAILTRYEDIRAVVNDRTLWRHPARADPESLIHRVSRRPDGSAPSEDTEQGSILFMDDPDHARIRQPLTMAFYKRAAKMRPATERIVQEVFSGLADRREIDIIEDIGVPVPIMVIAEILGVEKDRLAEFRAWSEGVILTLNPFRTPEQQARMEWAAGELERFFTAAMAERRARPRDDLLTDMVQLQAAGAPLSDAEVRINCGALLVAGNLTTTDLIGNGVLLLLRHPDQLARLRAEPGLINQAVEEILRYEGPVVVTGRVASREMEIGGCPVRQRTPVTTYLRAANRDPAVFADPDRFDITRKGPSHVSFGGGAHICIGAPLARLEAQVVLPMIFDRWPGMRLPDRELTWRALPGFRGLERLIVDV